MIPVEMERKNKPAAAIAELKISSPDGLSFLITGPAK